MTEFRRWYLYICMQVAWAASAACDLYYDDVSSISDAASIFTDDSSQVTGYCVGWRRLCVWLATHARTHIFPYFASARCDICYRFVRRTERINRRTWWSVSLNFTLTSYALLNDCPDVQQSHAVWDAIYLSVDASSGAARVSSECTRQKNQTNMLFKFIKYASNWGHVNWLVVVL